MPLRMELCMRIDKFCWQLLNHKLAVPMEVELSCTVPEGLVMVMVAPVIS